jgi:hypothetical protein
MAFLIPRPIKGRPASRSIMSISLVGLVDLGDCKIAAMLSINLLSRLHVWSEGLIHTPKIDLRNLNMMTKTGVHTNKGNAALCP